MENKKTAKISREALERYLLDNQNRNPKEVYADLRRIFNVSKTTISNTFKSYSIPRLAKIDRKSLGDYLLSHPDASVSEIMCFFCVSRSRVMQALHSYGFSRFVKCKHRIDVQALKDYVLSHPDATIPEVAVALNYQYNTTYKAIKNLGLPCKKGSGNRWKTSSLS